MWGDLVGTYRQNPSFRGNPVCFLELLMNSSKLGFYSDGGSRNASNDLRNEHATIFCFLFFVFFVAIRGVMRGVYVA